jgi:hypothetical protein
VVPCTLSGPPALPPLSPPSPHQLDLTAYPIAAITRPPRSTSMGPPTSTTSRSAPTSPLSSTPSRSTRLAPQTSTTTPRTCTLLVTPPLEYSNTKPYYPVDLPFTDGPPPSLPPSPPGMSPPGTSPPGTPQPGTPQPGSRPRQLHLQIQTH